MKLLADALRFLGADENTMMRLKKPMSGLSDAPRSWQIPADKRMRKTCLRVFSLDLCLCLSSDSEGHLDGVVSIYMDDLLGIGDLIPKTGTDIVPIVSTR